MRKILTTYPKMDSGSRYILLDFLVNNGEDPNRTHTGGRNRGTKGKLH